MKAVTLAITLIFVSGLVLLGEDKLRDWQEGTLIKITESQALHNYRFQPLVDSPGVEGDNDTFTQYTIQFDGQFLIADATVSGLFANAIKPKETPDLNSPIQFAIHKDTVYLKDKHGKEHKMHIEKRGVVANSRCYTRDFVSDAGCMPPARLLKNSGTNGTIQFRPEASAGLHRYDSSDVNVFLETLQEGINKVLAKQR